MMPPTPMDIATMTGASLPFMILVQVRYTNALYESHIENNEETSLP